MSFKQWRFQHLVIESVVFMLFGSFLVSRASAEDQQPFPNTTIALHVGYMSQSHQVLAEADIAKKVATPKLGFQNYMYNAYQASGVKGAPGQLQVEALAGVAAVRPYKEYVYYGPILAGGVARDANATGMAAKFAGVLGYRFGKSQKIAAEGVASADYSGLNTTGPQKLSRFVFTAFLGVRFGL